MKQSILLLWAVFFLSSCVSKSHMVEINDPYKEIKGIKLMQNLIGKSAEKNASISGNGYYSVSFSYVLESKKNELASLTLGIQTQTPIRADELDSVIFINLDNEKIKLVSSDSSLKKIGKNPNTTSSVSVATDDKKNEQIVTTTTENGNYQLMFHQYIIPENLWISIANTEKIQYRLYIGKEGIDVKLNFAQTAKLKEFLNNSMHLSNANLPPTPEGLKKL
jgi:hypothetical protein